ncbi:penicillin-binding protein 1A [Fluviispira multicolorata]|uniref:peptidoglycan glycosyltransferase n=1 Tax=Fluviispira multicolorata TaxID=2654512 RepID=A0A833JBU3_9BACT|nr:PBP1A family penicillin-binding protein [Fluviispira multicolorata]KAB8029826.1 PBP1A family penicillin-binding protein [Fluviispira multicolorata]
MLRRVFKIFIYYTREKYEQFLLSKIKKLFVFLFIFITILAFYKLYKIEKSLPSVEKLANYEPALPTVLYSQDGIKIAELFQERRYPVLLTEVTPFLKNAFIAAEDADFYSHKGLDFKGFFRAFYHFITFSNQKQGGSTITQQLAKNVLLTKERTITRKIKDILMARKIEESFSKDKILELYLNNIYLGNGAYGIEAASENYFRKSNIKLSLAQAALIAGLTPAPSAYDPTDNLEVAKIRQTYVLDRMLKREMITQSQYDRAIKEKITVYKAESPNNKVAPYFVAEVKKQLVNQLEIENIETSGLTIYTTLHSKIQIAAQTGVQNFSKQYEGRKSFKGAIKRHGEDIHDTILKLINVPLKEIDNEIAIVTSIDDELRSVGVVTQKGIGVLLAEDISWALHAGRSKETDLESLNYILKVGDEIHVQKVKGDIPARVTDNRKFVTKLQSHLKKFNITVSNRMTRYTLTDSVGIEAASMVMDAKTGEVLAMVGGENFIQSQFNRATQAERQVGSSVKPLYYSYAIDNGFSPASLIDSPQIDIDGWQPENYEGEETGRVTLRHSLTMSLNIPSIFLFHTVGATKISKQLNRFGFSWPSSDLSLALGSGSTSLLKMVQAYSVFANQGKLAQAYYIQEVVDRKGNIIYTARDKKIYASPVTPQFVEDAPYLPGKVSNRQEDPSSLQMISPQAAFVTLDLLRAVVHSGTGQAVLGVSPYVGGKTGTTNGNTDAWFMGVASQLVAGVWIGYDDSSKTLGGGGTGAGMAAPIWKSMMQTAVKVYPQLDSNRPNGVHEIRVDRDTGEYSAAPNSIYVYVIDGTEPGGIYSKNAFEDAQSELLNNSHLQTKPDKEGELPEGVPNPSTSGSIKYKSDKY